MLRTLSRPVLGSAANTIRRRPYTAYTAPATRYMQNVALYRAHQRSFSVATRVLRDGQGEGDDASAADTPREPGFLEGKTMEEQEEILATDPWFNSLTEEEQNNYRIKLDLHHMLPAYVKDPADVLARSFLSLNPANLATNPKTKQKEFIVPESVAAILESMNPEDIDERIHTFEGVKEMIDEIDSRLDEPWDETDDAIYEEFLKEVMPEYEKAREFRHLAQRVETDEGAKTSEKTVDKALKANTGRPADKGLRDIALEIGAIEKEDMYDVPPMLSSQAEHMMYQLHKTNPEEWSLEKLSSKFGTRIEATRAILRMQQEELNAINRGEIMNVELQALAERLRGTRSVNVDQRMVDQLGSGPKFEVVSGDDFTLNSNAAAGVQKMKWEEDHDAPVFDDPPLAKMESRRGQRHRVIVTEVGKVSEESRRVLVQDIDGSIREASALERKRSNKKYTARKHAGVKRAGKRRVSAANKIDNSRRR
eukprot:GFYU01009333.1.p1 GENE.GFYU01009333.1~~GFYU01009333.1.p1  ORF type:complete len:480 (-),score=112.63 GFYU01009333.1:372-1811(-)